VETYRDAGLGLLDDPTRRAIFELLARHPCSVGELAQHLPISRPAVSQHLRVLNDGGLVVPRAEGTRRVYQLTPMEWPPCEPTWTASGPGIHLPSISRSRTTPKPTLDHRATRTRAGGLQDITRGRRNAGVPDVLSPAGGQGAGAFGDKAGAQRPAKQHDIHSAHSPDHY
jgi:DNA-binding transcriptional ArsR family regulator